MQGHGHVYYRYLLPLLQLLREQCGQCSPDGFPDIVGFRLSLALGRAGANQLFAVCRNELYRNLRSFFYAPFPGTAFPVIHYYGLSLLLGSQF